LTRCIFEGLRDLEGRFSRGERLSLGLRR
ncbi:MAG: hypothetical protein JWP21_3228, partial [Tardiphaga sp.]|nr:hypothetical protein [Tardiphaga sp.]